MTLRQGEEKHWEKLKRVAGMRAFYRRGKEAVEMILVPGKGGNDVLGFGGEPLQDESKSFLLGVADLRNFFPPQENDVIQYHGDGQRWKVRKNANGSFHTESGNYGVMIRVHAVRR